MVAAVGLLVGEAAEAERAPGDDEARRPARGRRACGGRGLPPARTLSRRRLRSRSGSSRSGSSSRAQEVDGDEGDRNGLRGRGRLHLVDRPRRWPAGDLASAADVRRPPACPGRTGSRARPCPGVSSLSSVDPDPGAQRLVREVAVDDERLGQGRRRELGRRSPDGRSPGRSRRRRRGGRRPRTTWARTRMPSHAGSTTGSRSSLRLAPPEGLGAPGAGIGLHGRIVPAWIRAASATRSRNDLEARTYRSARVAPATARNGLSATVRRRLRSRPCPTTPRPVRLRPSRRPRAGLWRPPRRASRRPAGPASRRRGRSTTSPTRSSATPWSRRRSASG